MPADVGSEGIFLLDGAKGGGRREQHVDTVGALRRQKEPGSGVPTGLPSYKMLVAPRSSGP